MHTWKRWFKSLYSIDLPYIKSIHISTKKNHLNTQITSLVFFNTELPWFLVSRHSYLRMSLVSATILQKTCFKIMAKLMVQIVISKPMNYLNELDPMLWFRWNIIRFSLVVIMFLPPLLCHQNGDQKLPVSSFELLTGHFLSIPYMLLA